MMGRIGVHAILRRRLVGAVSVRGILTQWVASHHCWIGRRVRWSGHPTAKVILLRPIAAALRLRTEPFSCPVYWRSPYAYSQAETGNKHSDPLWALAAALWDEAKALQARHQSDDAVALPSTAPHPRRRLSGSWDGSPQESGQRWADETDSARTKRDNWQVEEIAELEALHGCSTRSERARLAAGPDWVAWCEQGPPRQLNRAVEEGRRLPLKAGSSRRCRKASSHEGGGEHALDLASGHCRSIRTGDRDARPVRTRCYGHSLSPDGLLPL